LWLGKIGKRRPVYICFLPNQFAQPNAGPSGNSGVDGVGGQNAGEKAASIAVDLIPDYLEKFEPGDILRGLESAIVEANYEILRQAELIPAYAGMACTCAAVLVAGNQLFIANVGDSRIYWRRQGILKQISRDHTLEKEPSHTGFENRADNE